MNCPLHPLCRRGVGGTPIWLGREVVPDFAQGVGVFRDSVPDDHGGSAHVSSLLVSFISGMEIRGTKSLGSESEGAPSPYDGHFTKDQSSRIFYAR
jgi:hypothetical protein